jgi:CheY-like chemotaxis protein
MTENILIIEDEHRLRMNLDRLLSDEGYHITTAANGHEGVQYLMHAPFDLVITDIMMEDGRISTGIHAGTATRRERLSVLGRHYSAYPSRCYYNPTRAAALHG